MGAKIKMIGGFNVFDTKNDDYRTYYGYGEEIEVELIESIKSGASSLTSVLSSLVVATAALSLF